MAFHIPFNQRASAQQRPEPIYIGFEVQRPPRQKFNWWGFNGMWMSFASLLTAGFFSPVPLLISLVGLRRPGKKMASVGTFVSFLGIALATTIVVGGIVAHNHQVETRRMARQKHVIQKQVKETNAMLAFAADEFVEYRDGYEGDVPFESLAKTKQAIEANMLVIKHIDPWGESLRFDMKGDGGVVRSAGPDKEFDTRDDLTLNVDGENETEDQPLLEVKKDVTEKDLMEDD